MRARLQQALQASQQSEAASLAREARLHTSLEAANVGTWDWNIRTGEVRWSDTLERIHGQSPGGFRGTFEGFLDGVHPEDRQRVLDAIDRARTAGAAYVIEYRSLVQGDDVRWFEGRGHVIPNEAGEPVWMSGICMDVTERHRFQEQLCQTQRLESLGLLAGGIAHDFNNLLVAIMGNASLARDTLPAAAPAIPLIQRVLTACERAALLTRRLLSYAGKEHSAVAPVNLADLVRDLGSLLRTSIPKLVNLSFELDEDLPPVLADEAQLQQVVMNLAINAAEAIPERMTGTVTLSTRRRRLLPEDRHCAVIPLENGDGEYVELSVRDTGCGMDLPTQTRIFDPFYSTKFTGRGLGLAAVLGIIGAHGGTITVRSAPGQGSCFTVLLPEARNCSFRSNSAQIVPRVARGSGTILIVDDEPAVCEMTRCALESSGYQVLLAGDGLEALQLVADHPEIRAIVLDLAMPRMGGDIAASGVRALRPQLPILLSSGYSEAEAERNFTEAGYSAFLQKPYTTTHLLQTLGRLLDRYA